MTNLIKQGSSLYIEGDINSFPFKNGQISLPLNSLYFVIDESNTVSFKQVNDNNTLLSIKLSDLQINGEAVTKENLIEKFDAVANGGQGGAKLNEGSNITLTEEEDGSITISASGELSATVDWADVQNKPNVATQEELASSLSAKQDTLVSGTNIKTINGNSILGEGDIEIQGGTGDVTQQYVDEQLALKVDKTAYEADKATFALKTEIPSIEGLATKQEVTEGLEGKQDKGDYALKSELSAKQDVLVSGTNIKTINGNSILGEGNIEIQGGGGGIADAPSDDKLYGRKNGNWSEVVVPDTSTFATKEEVNAKVSTETYNADKQTFALKSEIPNLSGYATEEWVESKGYLTEHQDISNLATKDELAAKLSVEVYNVDKPTFALKTEVENTYAKKTDIQSLKDSKADKTELANYATTSYVNETFAIKEEIPDVSELASKEELQETAATKQDTLVSGTNIKTINGNSILGEGNIEIQSGGGVADSVDWANVTSKPDDIVNITERLAEKANVSDLSNYLTTETAETTYQPIGDYATTTQLGTKLDVTTYNEEKSTFALKTEIPDTSTFATKSELEGKADKTQIADMLTKTEAASTYQPIGSYLTEIPSEYITDSELNAKGYKKIEYKTQEEYNSIGEKEEGVLYVITDAPEIEIPDTSTFATKEEVNAKQDTLVSGTNIKSINGNSILGSGDLVIPTTQSWVGTQTDYDLINPKDSNTLYFIVEEGV